MIDSILQCPVPGTEPTQRRQSRLSHRLDPLPDDADQASSLDSLVRTRTDPVLQIGQSRQPGDSCLNWHVKREDLLCQGRDDISQSETILSLEGLDGGHTRRKVSLLQES